MRAVVATFACAIAVAFVTSITVDLGPALRQRAETAGSNGIKRPMHIGKLGVHVWRGSFSVDDLVIEGLTPQSRPFLTAKHIDVSMPWTTLFTRRVVFDAIQMTDWDMFVELFADGSTNFVKLPSNNNTRTSAWTTTLQYVRASRGQFTYEDHGTPWSTVARNLDVTVARPANEYRGQARFSNGTVAIQSYVPMRADMSTTFRIVDGKIVLDRIDLQTDGAKTQLTGVVDMRKWPEQIYRIKSKIDFPTEKGIWFAHDNFTVVGIGDFTGTFHLFKEQLANGKTRIGRELKGDFVAPIAGVNAYRFGNLRGSVLWVPEKMEVTNATATLYGGDAKFNYRMAPLGVEGMPATATFDAGWSNVDVTEFTNFLELLSILMISAALCYTFGRMVGDTRQGWAILAAMTVVFVVLLAVCVGAEQSGNPVLAKLGVDQTASSAQPGGNMEGKEIRFGVVNSALWATATTAASNGSVNSMHDSFTPLGGLVPLWLIQLGEVIYGGVGSGLYGMLVFAIVAVFVAGLMIGRTPEYLGKKIEAFEIKMSAIVVLMPLVMVLGGTALGVMAEAGRAGVANPGAHGFSEILYGFSSAGNNNGSAFAGLSANTPFYNTALGIAMLFARFWLMVPVLALAGAFAAKKKVPAGVGTLPTHTPLFIFFLIGVVVIVGALTFIPALALGPVVEHLALFGAK